MNGMCFKQVSGHLLVSQVKIATFAGVEVCTRRLKRGDSYDFQVAVPAKPAQLRSLTALGSIDGTLIHDSTC